MAELENDAFFDWIADGLFTLTGVRVWDGVQEDGDEAIVASLNRDEGRSFHARRRVLTIPRWVVKAVVLGDVLRAREIAQEIDSFLDGKKNIAIGGGCHLVSCESESSVRYPEIDGQRTWFHRGGIYVPIVRREG